MPTKHTICYTLLFAFTGGIPASHLSAQTILYVDDDAPLGGDGSSWDNAFRFLSDALADAAAAAGAVDEVRVAAGLYLPNRSASQPAGTGDRSLDRSFSFVLIDGVAIRGGYGGIDAVSPDDRDIDRFVSTLSGDLLGDDVEDDPKSRADNSYHVVRSRSVGSTAILDGFSITAGVADGEGQARGGGMRNLNDGSPTVTRCRFFGNRSILGGAGMANINFSSPTVRNCVFVDNLDPTGNGAGMYCLNDCSPEITSCQFIGNSSGHVGGGLAMRFRCHPVVVNCLFSGNSARDFSGAVRSGNTGSSPTFVNCTFVGNSTPGVGGAYGAGSDSADALENPGHSILINCIFWGNISSDGSQIALNGRYRADVTVTRCIVEGGDAGTYVEPGFVLTWGEGNLDLDPRLKDSDGPDDIAGTEDDDVRLLPDSPSINMGLNSAPGLPANDMVGNDRIVCGVVDIGAVEAAEPVSGCQPRFVRGDCNGDGTVDISDAVSTLGSLFLGEGDPGCDDACDSNDDSAVDISDAIATLGVLFLGSGIIPLPGMNDCGVDPTEDGVNCDTFERCP